MEKIRDPKHFLNRELSWLEFNQRVLDEACDATNPLLERLKFFTIVSSNLDEFFEVRVAGLKQQIESGNNARTVDGRTPIGNIRSHQHRGFAKWWPTNTPAGTRNCSPHWPQHHIAIHEISSLNAADLAWVEDFYQSKVRPVLTPLAIDPAHPFPQLLNKSLNLMVRLEMAKDNTPLKHLAVVQCPAILPRLIQLPREDHRRDYVFLGQLIGHFLADLFPGTKLLGYWAFRLTRNSELYVDEGDTPNLLKAVEEELHKRRRGHAVRLEIDHDCPENIREALLNTLHLTEHDLYLVDGPAEPDPAHGAIPGQPFARVARPALPSAGGRRFAREKRTFLPPSASATSCCIIPTKTFRSVVDFLETAATDPDTLAIKMTLYRTGGDPRIVGALDECGEQRQTSHRRGGIARAL